jgi:hypothetical protein
MNLEEEFNLLKIENEKLKKELDDTKERLFKYTNTTKKYYEKNKDEIKQKVKEYKEKNNYTISMEKKKEYNRIAYLNKKEKFKKNENIQI